MKLLSRSKTDPRRRTPLSERLFRRFVYKYYGRNLLIDLQLHAKRESVAYILEHMQDAMMFRDRWDLLDFAVRKAPAEGLVLEFGVEKGDSLSFMAQRTPRTVHGFDSFEGLPEDWAGTFERRGKFSRGGALPTVPANAKLHVGWFDAVLPGFLAQHPEPIALLHVDCDLYSSTKTVFDLAGGRLRPGSIIVFDEYFNYPNWKRHEHRAFQEFVAASGCRYDYIGFTEKNGHVAAIITEAAVTGAGGAAR
jgi:methyltransferase family protein